MLAASVVVWLSAFLVLRETGSWTVFAFVGPVLATLILVLDGDARTLLRPTPTALAAGLGLGVLMVVATHGAYALLAPLLPDTSLATFRLFGLLNVPGFSPLHRALLIVLIASSEEVIFRGPLMGKVRDATAAEPLDLRYEARRVLVFAMIYALGTLTLQSALLVLTAFCCGIAWGALRVATRSLLAPVLAHVVWDLGVLVVWQVVKVDAG